MEETMTRNQLTDLVYEAKRAKGLAWKDICKKINPKASPVLLTAALLGQMKLEPGEAKKAEQVLGLPKARCPRFRRRTP
jgi:cyanate lyase